VEMERVAAAAYPAPLFVRIAPTPSEPDQQELEFLVDLALLQEVAWLFPPRSEAGSLDWAAMNEALSRLRWCYLEGHQSGRLSDCRRGLNYTGLVRATWASARELACHVGDCPPPEPCDTEGGHAFRNAIDQLIAWCRQHEQANTTQPRAARLPGEAEEAVRAYLKEHPGAKIREVSEATGVSVGKISSMSVWQASRVVKSAMPGRPSRPPRERPLTPRMLAALGTDDDPAERLDRAEVAWRRLLERATEVERERFNAMPPAQQRELIEAFLAQQEDLASTRSAD